MDYAYLLGEIGPNGTELVGDRSLLDEHLRNVSANVQNMSAKIADLHR